MNETIKAQITAKNALFKKYIQNGRIESDFVCLENFIIELNKLISSTKALYYENLAKKLKLVSTIFYQFFIFSPHDILSKTIKNVFYLIEKALFVLKIFKFL